MYECEVTDVFWETNLNNLATDYEFVHSPPMLQAMAHASKQCVSLGAEKEVPWTAVGKAAFADIQNSQAKQTAAFNELIARAQRYAKMPLSIPTVPIRYNAPTHPAAAAAG